MTEVFVQSLDCLPDFANDKDVSKQGLSYYIWSFLQVQSPHHLRLLLSKDSHFKKTVSLKAYLQGRVFSSFSLKVSRWFAYI